MTQASVDAAEVVLSCTDLERTLPFFTDTLGFRVDTVFPADDPREAQISGFGLRLRLQRGEAGDSSVIRLLCRALPGGADVLVAPNGTRVECIGPEPAVVVPPPVPTLVVTRADDGPGWHTGRAGMQYRDLVPDRQGGHIIASHIRIPGGGPVPDYVHYHRIRLQLIYCRKGWVRVVYEDQGPPFVLAAGDCVLQPPEIRHRVLESGDDLEVVEVGCPAEHMTCVDHDLVLPTTELRPDRDYAGQRFVRHVAAEAVWRRWRLSGFEARDTGIGAATAGIGGAQVVRVSGTPEPRWSRHQAQSLFLFLLQGGLLLETEGGRRDDLTADDSCMLPPGLGFRLAKCSADLQLLEVAMPAQFATAPA